MMNPMPDFEPRALLGAIGAGATICAVQFVGLMAFTTELHSRTLLEFAGYLLMLGVMTWLIAAIGFFVGLLFVGIPVWAGLVAFRRTSRGAAVAAGAALAALAGVGIARSAAGDFQGAWMVAAFLVLPGAFAGWTLHRVAYGKAPLA
jgi:hypothetical protein